MSAAKLVGILPDSADQPDITIFEGIPGYQVFQAVIF
jgi:hypothetical protein